MKRDLKAYQGDFRCRRDNTTAVGTRLHNYQEVRACLEKEHPDWLRALTPRHINAPADYWPQKVLAVSSANAAMQNYFDIHEHQTKPNPVLAAVQGQAVLLLRHDVPTYYVSRELLAAALRTELPDDMVFAAIPFPFDALVFMLPKGTVCHPTDGDSSSRYRSLMTFRVTGHRRSTSSAL